MNALTIMFYAISVFILAMGLMAVTSTKIFRSAIWLLLSLVGIAVLYFWMQLEFIAAIQIIVYAGGIVVLIIFSIFLTQQSGKKMPKPSILRIVTATLATLFGLAFSFNLINHYGFDAGSSKHFNATVSEMGTQLLSTTKHGYILPFEVVSMLLLSAMVGCIVVAMKSPETEIKKIEPIPEDEKENTFEPLITTEV